MTNHEPTAAGVEKWAEVRIDGRLHQAAGHIAGLRGERVEDVVARILKGYARGRRRPRAAEQGGADVPPGLTGSR